MSVNYKKYGRRALMPSSKQEIEEFDSVNLSNKNNMYLLLRYKEMWDNLYQMRVDRRRAINYTFGKQWNDLIEDQNSKGKLITEEMHIINQGKVPLKNNLIRQLNKSVLGTFRSNRTEPMATSRDRDEQKLGEMMSIAMQYAYQENEGAELDARALEEFLWSSIACQVVRYKWHKTRKLYEVYFANENPSKIFFNSDVQDPRGTDINCFGVLRDISLADVISEFAKSREDAVRIREMYKTTDANIASQYRALSSKRIENMDFFIGEQNLCRVIEAWQLESKERYLVHDTAEGVEYIVDLDKKKSMDDENRKRIQEATLRGMNPEDVLTIEYKWMIDQYWYVRYLTPTGDVLYEGETPFEHNEHPFVFKAYPLVDGEIHSFVEDVIDQQRYINRLITMIDFIMGSSAKGVLIFPEELLGSQTKDEVLEEWVKFNGVIFAKSKAGIEMPKQISSNSTNIGAYELLNIQLKLLNDISGVHGAMQGQSPNAGTPAAMYAQEAQNATTNLIDLFETFNSFRKQRNYKMMKVIQQKYDSPRYINIAGKEYSEESKWYDPEKIRNASFDTSISEVPTSPAFRAGMNAFLLDLYKTQAISVKQLLEVGDFPFADRLLASIKTTEQQMQDQQGNPGVSPPVEIPQEIQQGANPTAMEMFDKMQAVS